MAQNRKYTIEKLISDDTGGSVFRATDEMTKKLIALRRIAPSHTMGRSLNAEEQVAYQVAIGRLSQIRHASLRPIVSGYCDSKDGTPFLAADWTDAEPLLRFLHEKPLAEEIAIKLISELLEVCALLSTILAEEGIWVETELETIAMTSNDDNDRFVFWASPLKWLSGNDQARSLNSVIDLTEQLMGWKGRELDENDDAPLYTWLKWLKGEVSKEGATLREVREMLAASAGIEPPAPIDTLVKNAKKQQNWSERVPGLQMPKIQQPKMPLFALLSGMLILEAIGGWLWVRKINNDSTKSLNEINLNFHDSPDAASVNDTPEQNDGKTRDEEK